ncbi:hypothetical protein [Mycobacterium sp. URHB0021]|jgi:hypothetical protein
MAAPNPTGAPSTVVSRVVWNNSAFDARGISGSQTISAPLG